MSALIKKLTELNQNLVVLKKTRTISKDDLVFPEFYELNEDYKAANEPLHKVIVSIKNSLITQRRIVFCMTRDEVRELIKNDNNHKNKVGLDNNKWSELLLLCYQSGLMSLVKEGDKRVPAIYKVVDKSVLSYLNVSEAVQLAQAIEFTTTKSSSDHKADHKADVVISNENKKEEEASSNEIASTENTQSCQTESAEEGTSFGIVSSSDTSEGTAKTASLPVLEQVAITPANTGVIKFEAIAAHKTFQKEAPLSASHIAGIPASMTAATYIIQDQKKESSAKERKGNQEPNADDVRMIESAIPKNEWESTFLEACKQAVVQFGSLTDGKRRVLARMQSSAASEPTASPQRAYSEVCLQRSLPTAKHAAAVPAVSAVKKPLEGAAVSSIMYSKLSAEDKAKQLSEFTWVSAEKVAECISLYSTSQEEIETIISSLNLPFTETVKKRIKTINNQLKRA